MPELPEIETTVRDLQRKVLNRTFIDIWTDAPKLVKKPTGFNEFKKRIQGKKIEGVSRRGKNILIELSGGDVLLIHQKLTGHLLFGKWERAGGKWQPPVNSPLAEKINTYLHLLFIFKDGTMLALSDLRKFAKVEILSKKELKEELKNLGPEPLSKDFTFDKFKETLKGVRGKIKQVLMDQTVIAGIGNIYSDEILFEAKIHPLKRVENLSEEELKRIFQAMKKILKKAISLKGESISDYRTLNGKKGGFDRERKVYRRGGEPCLECGTKIRRIKIGGRSAHFCPRCQKL